MSHSVEHVSASVEPLFDRLASARVARRRNAETRRRLQVLHDEYLAAFDAYAALQESVDASDAEIRAARSQAWALHSEYAHERHMVDSKLWPAPGRRAR